ncbi:MAG: hypothetical protein CMJ83_16070 [Planctomycetes bacterium]|nr:hypothetical protein [Planctomycetota bacterium]
MDSEARADASERIAIEFLTRLLEDRAQGRERPLSVYLARYRGHEETIEREFARLGAATDLDPATSSGHREDDRHSVGPYRLIREIGRGGQGQVWLAEDTRLGREIALKLLPRPIGDGGSSSLRFQREAEVASRLDDPGICPVYDVGVHDGTAYIAMRHVQGKTLATIIGEARQAGPPATSTEVDLAFRLGIMESAARSLHVAHEAGVLHRDVKPGNIMVEGDRAVILDFGLARDEAAITLTGSHEVFGTPAYMAPEQIRPQGPAPDQRTDVYALGVTLFECVTLRRPHDALTREALYRQILFDEPPRLRRVNPRLPRDLEAVAETAMQKDPDRRYQTALDLADDLQRVSKLEPTRARRVPAPARLVRWAHRHPARAALGLALVLIASILGYLGANLDRIQAQQEVERQRRLELLLERGFIERTLDPRGEASRAAFEEALRLAPDSAEALAGLARAMASNPGVDSALDLLDANKALATRHIGLQRLRCLWLERADRENEAEVLRPKLREPETALDFYISALALNRTKPNRERAARCQQWFKQAVLTAPKPRLLYHYAAAKTALESGDFADAHMLAAAAFRRWPDKWPAWFLRGRVLSEAPRSPADVEEAVRCYEQVLRMSPGNRAAIHSLGSVFTILRRFDEALACFDEALAGDSADVFAHASRAQTLASLDRLDEAVVAIRAALKIEDNPRFLQVLGRLYAKRKEFEQSLVVLRRALKRGIDNWNAHHDLGNALANLQRYEEAVSPLQRAVALDPGAARSWSLLGAVLEILGHHQNALDALDRAKALGLQGDVDHNRGMALTNLGRLEEAEAAYAEALEVQPQSAADRLAHGRILLWLGRFAEADASLQIAAADPSSPYAANARKELARQRRYVDLERRLDDIVAGRAQLAPKARLEAAWVAAVTGRLRDAARLGQEALEGDPALVRARSWQYQWEAARVAGRLAWSKDPLPPDERARLRSQCREWMAGMIHTMRRLVDSRRLEDRWVADQLQRFLRDEALAPFQLPPVLLALSETERKAWKTLREEIDDLLADVGVEPQ